MRVAFLHFFLRGKVNELLTFYKNERKGEETANFLSVFEKMYSCEKFDG